MNIVQIITALLPVFAQFEPALVKDVADLIHGNPRLQDETDEAYATRVLALAEAKLKDAQANDAAVEATDTSVAPTS